MKPKVAIFDFASCEGCELQIVNLEEEVVDLVNMVDVVSFREAMKEHSNEYDVAIVEGAIERPMDEKRIKEIRSKAKILIALGDCACNGGVTKLRNEMTVHEAKREVYGSAKTEGNHLFDMISQAKSLDEVVPVDFYIRGCPVRKEQLLYYIKRLHSIPPHKNLEVRFKITTKETPIDDRSLVYYNPKKCILCRRCDVMCHTNLGIDALGMIGKGLEITMSTPRNIGFDKNNCIRCGQCISVCSVGALETKSTVAPLVKALKKGTKKQIIAIDSIALASLVEKQPFLAELPPAEAEKLIISSLGEAGFSSVLQYEYYINESMKQDSKHEPSKMPVMLSWCKGAFNYAKDRFDGTVDVSEKRSPWQILLNNFKGKRVDVSLLSPCTALKGVDGFSHVLSVMELDELFKKLGIEPSFGASDVDTYDAPVNRANHPGRTQTLQAKLASSRISKGTPEWIKSMKSNNTYLEIYPCIERCLSGGGNYPTVDYDTVTMRRKWLETLWGVSR
ncbi:MAG: 4Fe-4S binding protein [Thermoplasmata archaeon]